ncbi:MAG: PKD domain-containing protein [candidate division WOR-3 bacterium]
MRLIIAVLLLFAGILATEPPESISVTVPEYTIKEIGGLHYVEIAGGKLLMHDGQPRLPFYPVTVNYPGGYYVQDVILIQKSGLKKETGIRLPEIQITVDTGETFQPPRAAVTKGWYPEKDFDWRIWHSPKGGTDLVLSVYPLQFNSDPGELVFHSEYQFRVKYIKTGITVVGVSADKVAYEIGERVKFALKLNNSAAPKEIVISPRVNGSVAIEIPERRARISGGDTTLIIEWDTKTAPVGDYTVQFLLTDDKGNTVGKTQTRIRLGMPAGEIISFTAEPNIFRIGDDVHLTLKFQNTGSAPLNGEGVFRIFKNSSVINELTSPFTALAPNSTTTLTQTYKTDKAEKGANYYIAAFVRYDGNTTPAQQILLSTNQQPVAKFLMTPEVPMVGEQVSFDASGSTDGDGKIVDYNWEFGDGATAQGEKTKHRYQLPGVYEVKLIVTDNEGGKTTTTRQVEVKE